MPILGHYVQTLSHPKPEVHSRSIATPPEKDQAMTVGNTHSTTSGEDSKSTSGDMLATQTYTQAHRQTEALITILRSLSGSAITKYSDVANGLQDVQAQTKTVVARPKTAPRSVHPFL